MAWPLIGSFTKVQELDMQHVKLFCRLLCEWSRLLLETRRWPDDQLFIRAAYRAYLKREPDEAGLRCYLQLLQFKNIDRLGVLRSMVQSIEFRQLRGLPIHYLDALHLGRIVMVKHFLPPAQVILDLGGAASGTPYGSLLAMGYPHHPHEIIIVDLPPAQRCKGSDSPWPLQTFLTADGVSVRYLYRSMTDLSPISNGSIDLVWSGESIEHVTEEEADTVCREAYRVLRPGGYFCLDTPNAALTRLQSPDALIHPEHKKEYYVWELRTKLVQWGFEVLEARGICPMPDSLQKGIFRNEEILRNIGLSDAPEQGYLFYLKAIKPAPENVSPISTVGVEKVVIN